ncbi:CC/Se motif family (seleno)protein [Dethiosulfatarculus sandiegensis]|uniref:FeS cluster biogenesis domain-containing protein n=1 Tax=Dethiosulfatarculus sandiegensis TaxID=1429043 RepID=A0A0D2JQA0_9BACT|nr:CC/Se motif family (seleno)protein [Dethiosulfatarculus sandiegensis]KIX11670.1 hypothetical protein X474_23255 [Dethiosulfatarculus sandiegensis]
MRITVTPEAREFAKKNGISDISFVHHAPDVACCLGVAHEVLVAYEKPPNAVKYHYHLVDGLNLYIDKDLLHSEDLTLKVRGIFNKRLDLDGLICKAI